MSQIKELPEHLKKKAKEELNEDPERVQKDLEYIKDWLKKQPHLNARTDDRWLLAFLRGSKFSLERTKEKLDMFYTLRTMCPEFFTNRDPMRPEIQAILKKGLMLPLKDTKDPLSPRCILLRNTYDPAEISMQDIFKTNMMMMDISLLEDDLASVNGVRVVQDHSGMTMAHMPPISVTRKAMANFQDAYPNRIKGLHIFNAPSFFETVFNMFKPFFNEKIKSRLYIHGSDMESLYAEVPKEILPKEYGGNGDSIEEIADHYKKIVESYRDWFLDDAKYGTDEKKRPGKPKTSDELFGIEGSFRKLNVD